MTPSQTLPALPALPDVASPLAEFAVSSRAAMTGQQDHELARTDGGLAEAGGRAWTGADAGETIALQIVDTLKGLCELEAEWRCLFKAHARSWHMFQSYDWCAQWSRTFLQGVEDQSVLRIVAGRRNGRLVFLAPFAIERVNGLTRLTWVGNPVTQYGDVIAAPGVDVGPALEAAFQQIRLRDRADYIHLPRVRRDAEIFGFLRERGANVTQILSAPYLDLASHPDFESYSQTFSSKARKNRRRALRRLSELGRVEIRTLLPGAQAERTVIEALELKREWLEAKGKVSRALYDVHTDAFFQALAANSQGRAGVRVSELRVEGKLAAAEIGFACRGRLAVHVIVYAKAFEKYSPGALLMEASIAQCMAEGFSSYDLLAPGDPYKLTWADDTQEVCDFDLPLSLAGRAWVSGYIGFLRPRMKAGLEGMPMPVRRLGRRAHRLAASLLG